MGEAEEVVIEKEEERERENKCFSLSKIQILARFRRRMVVSNDWRQKPKTVNINLTERIKLV